MLLARLANHSDYAWWVFQSRQFHSQSLKNVWQASSIATSTQAMRPSKKSAVVECIESKDVCLSLRGI